MDDNLYDEFGNYIGPDLPEVENGSLDAEEEQEEPVNKDEENQNVVNIAVILSLIQNENYSIVLHEDKNYYQSANDIYPVALFINLRVSKLLSWKKMPNL